MNNISAGVANGFTDNAFCELFITTSVDVCDSEYCLDTVYDQRRQDRLDLWLVGLALIKLPLQALVEGFGGN